MNRFILGTGWLGLVLLAGVLAGCKTNDTAHTGNQASVIITGHTKEEIQQTTIAVFKSDGYTQVADLVFEKEGSKWDTVTYGSLGSKSVWIKIRVSLTSKGEGRNALGCDVYAVDNHGEGFMESERKLAFAKGDECKEILDQIKQRLSLSPPKPT